MPLEIDGVLHYRCPRRPILEQPGEFGSLFWLFQQFERGVLPEDGGILSQPEKMMQQFRFMQSVVSECHDQLSKKPDPPAAMSEPPRGSRTPRGPKRLRGRRR